MKQTPSSVPLSEDYNVYLCGGSLERSYRNVDKKNTPKNNPRIALLDQSIDEVNKLRDVFFNTPRGEQEDIMVSNSVMTLFDSYIFDFISAKDEATKIIMATRLSHLLHRGFVIDRAQENYKLDMKRLFGQISNIVIRESVFTSSMIRPLNPIFDELRKIPKFLTMIETKATISSSKKELKETLENVPQLDEQNFRVEDTSGRKEIIDDDGVKYLEHPEWDVREFVSGVPSEFIGQQRFTGDKVDGHWNLITQWSATRETQKAWRKLPPSAEIFENIIDIKYQWWYQDFLIWEKVLFPVLVVPDLNVRSLMRSGSDMSEYNFYTKWLVAGNEFGFWTGNGSVFYWGKHTWQASFVNNSRLYSVRCIKD